MHSVEYLLPEAVQAVFRPSPEVQKLYPPSEWLIETGQQFGRRFEKQEEINRLRKAAGKVAEKIGVSPDEGYQIIRIIYTRCTPEELIDAYRTAKGTC